MQTGGALRILLLQQTATGLEILLCVLDGEIGASLMDLRSGVCVCTWDTNEGRCVSPRRAGGREVSSLFVLESVGPDARCHLMLVCPNHHRAIHRCDAPLDGSDRAYDFGNHCEAGAVDRYLT